MTSEEIDKRLARVFGKRTEPLRVLLDGGAVAQSVRIDGLAGLLR